MTQFIKTPQDVMTAADNRARVQGRYHGIAFTGTVEKSRYNHRSGLEDLYVTLDDLAIFEGTPCFQAGRSPVIILCGWTLQNGTHTAQIAE